MTSRCERCFRERSANDPACSCRATDTQDFPIALAAGTVLNGRYSLGRVLGLGGFGITYLGWDLHLNIRLAIKEYFPRELATRGIGEKAIRMFTGTQSAFETGLEKFLEEARKLSSFDEHEGIVSVRDYLTANATAYMVMNYVSGRTVKQLVAEQPDRRFSPEDTVKLLMPVMDALNALHEADILHRDISPDNIYVTDKNQVKLLDFGAARHAVQLQNRTASMILKIEYAPIEQFQSTARQGPWTDVYALGATMYELMTGRLPPRSIDRLADDGIVRPSALGIEIDDDLEHALLQCLEVLPENRFQHIRAVQEAMAGVSFLDNSGLTGTRGPLSKLADPKKAGIPGHGRLFTLPFWAAAAVLLVGLIGWGWTWTNWNQDARSWSARKALLEAEINRQQAENDRLNGNLTSAVERTEAVWNERLTEQNAVWLQILQRYGGWWTEKFRPRIGIFNLGGGSPDEFEHYFLALRTNGDIGRGSIVRGHEWLNRTQSRWKVVYGFARDSGEDYFDHDDLLYLGPRWEDAFKDIARLSSGGETQDGFHFVRQNDP